MNPTSETLAYWDHINACAVCHHTTRKWYWTEYGLCASGRELLYESMDVSPTQD